MGVQLVWGLFLQGILLLIILLIIIISNMENRSQSADQQLLYLLGTCVAFHRQHVELAQLQKSIDCHPVKHELVAVQVQLLGRLGQSLHVGNQVVLAVDFYQSGEEGSAIDG